VTGLSDDQLRLAEAVAKAGAQVILGRDSELVAADYAGSIAALTPVTCVKMSQRPSICDAGEPSAWRTIAPSRA